LRQHRFAGAWKALHQEIMSPGRGDLECAFRERLTANVAEVGKFTDERLRRATWQQRPAREMRADREQAGGRVDDDIAYQRRFAGAGHGQDKRATFAMRLERHRQRSTDRPQFAGQCQLARELVGSECRRRNLPRCCQDPERDRQIESARLLGQVGGGEIGCDPACRKLEMRVLQCGTHAVPTFLDLGLRKTHKVARRQATGKMHLDRDRRRVEAGERA
jgi:hypothetical protein